VEISNKIIQDNVIYYRPTQIYPSAWISHIPFMEWYMRNICPKVFVELGVHYGTSFLTACEIVKSYNIQSKCVAVDTWKGDSHSGLYDEEVFSKFMREFVKYESFAEFKRKTFEEALHEFEDNSIDLLHIDGFHTYQAVKKDFSDYLPKMSNSGVIIMHDINVHTRGFGVYLFWQELKEKYATFEFLHGHGLGIVLVGTDVNRIISELINNSEHGKDSIKNLFKYLGSNLENEYYMEQEKENLKNNMASIEIHCANISQENNTLKEQISKMEEKVNLFEHSISWRITKPIRKLKNVFK
jgi:hypothetical protein